MQAVKRVASSADFVQAMLALRPEGGKKARLRRTVDRAISITHVSALAGRLVIVGEVGRGEKIVGKVLFEINGQ